MLRIEHVRPHAPEVARLVAVLDRLQIGLYGAECCHLDGLDELSGDNVTMLGAYRGDQLAGIGALKRRSDANGTPYGELKRIVVDDNHQRRGVGRALLEALETVAMAQGLRLVRLETGVKQKAAIGLYTALGYRECPPFGSYTKDGVSLYMDKQLREPSDASELLGAGDVIDWQHPDVRALAHDLTAGNPALEAVGVAFRWVRDQVAHTADAGQGAVTWRASDVLRERTGFCYAKSHLLVALLRAAGIQAGLCYQRLRFDGPESKLTLHGLVGVRLPSGDIQRIDPRGNKPGVQAEFVPGREVLAFPIQYPGECDLPGVFADPLPEVVEALSSARDWRQLLDRLPDVPPERWSSR